MVAMWSREVGVQFVLFQSNLTSLTLVIIQQVILMRDELHSQIVQDHEEQDQGLLHQRRGAWFG